MNVNYPLYRHYRQRLSKSTVFQSLPLEVLDEMLKNFRFETWTKGSQHDAKLALWRFYVIMEGRMELIQINPDTGKIFTIMILKAGDIYDVLGLLDNQEHNIIPVALDDLKLLSAPVSLVRKWLHQYEQFNENLMPHLSQCIRLREEVATDLALHDTPTRLARVILRHLSKDDLQKQSRDVYREKRGEENGEKNREGSSNAHGDDIIVELLHDLSNEQLARLVGSVRQVINSHLGQMKKEGLIHMDHHRIIIDDLQRLEERAEVMHEGLMDKSRCR